MNATHTRLFARIAGIAFAAAIGTVAHAQDGIYHGELFIEKPMSTGQSTVSRDELKAATRAANTDGGLGNNGRNTYERSNYRERDALATSSKTRAERKAETMVAVRDHKLVAAGEGLTSAH